MDYLPKNSPNASKKSLRGEIDFGENSRISSRIKHLEQQKFVKCLQAPSNTNTLELDESIQATILNIIEEFNDDSSNLSSQLSHQPRDHQALSHPKTRERDREEKKAQITPFSISHFRAILKDLFAVDLRYLGNIEHTKRAAESRSTVDETHPDASQLTTNKTKEEADRESSYKIVKIREHEEAEKSSEGRGRHAKEPESKPSSSFYNTEKMVNELDSFYRDKLRGRLPGSPDKFKKKKAQALDLKFKEPLKVLKAARNHNQPSRAPIQDFNQLYASTKTGKELRGVDQLNISPALSTQNLDPKNFHIQSKNRNPGNLVDLSYRSRGEFEQPLKHPTDPDQSLSGSKKLGLVGSLQDENHEGEYSRMLKTSDNVFLRTPSDTMAADMGGTIDFNITPSNISR